MEADVESVCDAVSVGDGEVELLSLTVGVLVGVGVKDTLDVVEIVTETLGVLLDVRETLRVNEIVPEGVGVALTDRVDENDLMLLPVADGDNELDKLTVAVEVGELPTDRVGDFEAERVVDSERVADGVDVGCSTTSSFASKYAVDDNNVP